MIDEAPATGGVSLGHGNSRQFVAVQSQLKQRNALEGESANAEKTRG
jgi:hypothetical protein